MSQEPYQPDLSGIPKPENSFHPIIIELSGLGPIPSFKNRKLIRTWLDKSKRERFMDGELWIAKKSLKIKSFLYLEPAIQRWMDRATSLIGSQLRSALATTIEEIRTGVSPRSRIATFVPLEDCWTSFREVIVKSEKCEKGQEGATIVIERM